MLPGSHDHCGIAVFVNNGAPLRRDGNVCEKHDNFLCFRRSNELWHLNTAAGVALDPVFSF